MFTVVSSGGEVACPIISVCVLLLLVKETEVAFRQAEKQIMTCRPDESEE